MAIIVPLAFLKKLDSMKYTSFLALIAVVYLVIIMIVTAIHPFAGATAREPFVWGKVTLSGFEKLPIYIFAFTCHQNVTSFCFFRVVHAAHERVSDLCCLQ